MESENVNTERHGCDEVTQEISPLSIHALYEQTPIPISSPE